RVLLAGGIDASLASIASTELFLPSTQTPPGLVSISVSPAAPSIFVGATQRLAAIGTFSDNSTQTLASVAWNSSNLAVAAVTNDAGNRGMALAGSVGSATVSATAGAISGSATLTVTPQPLVSIAVTPANPSVAAGLTQQYTATGTYADNSTQNLTSSVTWSSSNTAVATIASGGLATSLAQGTTTIQATQGAVMGSATLIVTAPTLVSIAVTPASPSVAAGLTKQFAATGTYTDSSTQNLTGTVTWSS